MPLPLRCDRVALTGDVALEIVASYFRDAGFDVMPQDASLDAFRPDFVYDVTSRETVLAKEVPNFYDRKFEALSGCRFSADGIRAIVDEFKWLAASSARKILAVDADNTLWSGILSEDGADALVPYSVFQQGLSGLRDDGAVLVLLSKNDSIAGTGAPVDSGVFAVQKVNWSPKAGNLLEACAELDLSPDAVVFLDDNPHERAQMSAHLPEVAVAPWKGWRFLPGDSGSSLEQRQLVRRLREYFFSGLGKTDEDRLRADDYAARSKRAAAKLNFATRDEYLDDLGLQVKPSIASERDLDRLAQMAGKTNQFNATTIRRTREDFERLIASPSYRVFVFRAGDRFGEQGLVCYVVVDTSRRRIVDFVMSCRAMGRTLEHFALLHVEKSLGYRPGIDFVPTAKNKPFADFLAALDDGVATHYREVDEFVV